MTLVRFGRARTDLDHFLARLLAYGSSGSITASTYLLLLLHGYGDGEGAQRDPASVAAFEVQTTLQLSPKHVPVPARGSPVAKPQARSLLPFVLLTFASSSSHHALSLADTLNPRAPYCDRDWGFFLFSLYLLVLSLSTRHSDKVDFLVLASLSHS
jgi:hypothetical protein